MLKIQKILVPTDFSAASDLALRYGHEMAQSFGAQLTVMHIVDDPILFAATTSDEFREETTRKNAIKLEENVRQEIGDVTGIELVTKCESAATEIVDFAKEQNMDMLVMGSHGRSAMASMLLGNVAEHVLRHSPCPVVAIRSPEHNF